MRLVESRNHPIMMNLCVDKFIHQLHMISIAKATRIHHRWKYSLRDSPLILTCQNVSSFADGGKVHLRTSLKLCQNVLTYIRIEIVATAHIFCLFF
jgi:hypothetical protein